MHKYSPQSHILRYFKRTKSKLGQNQVKCNLKGRGSYCIKMSHIFEHSSHDIKIFKCTFSHSSCQHISNESNWNIFHAQSTSAQRKVCWIFRIISENQCRFTYTVQMTIACVGITATFTALYPQDYWKPLFSGLSYCETQSTVIYFILIVGSL